MSVMRRLMLAGLALVLFFVVVPGFALAQSPVITILEKGLYTVESEKKTGTVGNQGHMTVTGYKFYSLGERFEARKDIRFGINYKIEFPDASSIPLDIVVQHPPLVVKGISNTENTIHYDKKTTNASHITGFSLRKDPAEKRGTWTWIFLYQGKELLRSSFVIY